MEGTKVHRKVRSDNQPWLERYLSGNRKIDQQQTSVKLVEMQLMGTKVKIYVIE